MVNERTIAYFSMEIGIDPRIPTYSGGLGVLAGDTIRSAADLNVPMVAVTLLHRKGYFLQKLDSQGRQTEEPAEWVVGDFLTEMPERVSVSLEGRAVAVRCWRYDVVGVTGGRVPVYLLDSDLPDNDTSDRTLTEYLYGGDERYRLCQEAILGIGGVRMLRALGHVRIERFHMNEGHASLLTLELLDEEARRAGRSSFQAEDIEAVRRRCVFTTHTPVPAGHDQFPMDLVSRVLGERSHFTDMPAVFCCEDLLNMTYLALNLSRYVNGVAKKHGEVSRLMFAGYTIHAITNGVHAVTWTSEPFQQLYDRLIPEWRHDNFALRSAIGIRTDEILDAHQRCKARLISLVNQTSNIDMQADVLTLGFARRATLYKRADLFFADTERLRQIVSAAGPLQLVFAGKAHPRDDGGKELIKKVFQFREMLKDQIRLVYLENYEMELAKLLVSGVDVWLNTPQPPMEASGTSGMKAALNGVPSLSVLDGWWIEGCIEGVTGWSIGEDVGDPTAPIPSSACAALLYDKLEHVIMPLFYNDRSGFAAVMKGSIALNGSFFNTQRMVQEYVLNAYFP